ncbi:condensation domain-containing protein [Marinomonas fungiae]|uniref:condensation domain-containing protein n=1 Tax=Marinomonas fungiae TaxID=1137284 RepID=UPI003A8F4A62
MTNAGIGMFLQVSDAKDRSSSVTTYEERIWLLQLQQPEEVSRSINAWRLSDDIDLAALERVILDVVDSVPDLNARYDFNDEGEVIKYYAQESETVLESAVTQADISDYLSQRKAFDWQADKDAPFFAALVTCADERFLVLESHPIVDEVISFAGIVDQIERRYQDKVALKGAIGVTPFASPYHDNHDSESEAGVSQSNDTQSFAHLILEEFRSVLHEPDMSLEDDFFDWGGHSLLATRVIGKLNQTYGFELSFNDFFRSATAQYLASQVTLSGVEAGQELDSYEYEEDVAPLTLAQDFLWQAYSGYDFSPIYNLPFAIKFIDEVDENIFYQAFADVLVRHAGLRTQFQINQGNVTQKVVSSVDLSLYKWFWQSSESEGISLSDEACYKFDLSQELPLRVRFMARNSGEPQVLSMLVHHMVIDEWSLNTIMQDLAQAYLSRANQEAPNWPATVPAIGEFARQQARQGVNREYLQYWTEHLQGAPKGLNLVGAEAAPLSLDENSASNAADWIELDLGLGAFAKLTEIARQHQASLFGVLYSAIALALHCHSDGDELVIGTSASGRTDAKYFDTVGYFTTMVAHRVQFNQHASLADLVVHVSEQINDSMDYADIPINLIQEALGYPIENGLLFDVYVHIHSNNALHGALKSPTGDLFYQQIPPEKNDSMFGLHFEIMDDTLPNGEHSLRIVMTYQKQRYSKAQIERISTQLSQVLDTMYADNLQHVMIERFHS